MKFRILILLFFGLINDGFGQNLNMIIDVNDELLTNYIGDAYLNFENENGTKEKILIGYHPGELILNENAWNKIKSDETTEITFSFTYSTWKRQKQESVNFKMNMKKYHFEKQYLILHIYDFRERKYRRKYGCLTDQDYIYDFNFPQGGILISCG